MADYYPVLKKTVAALPENTGAARREIYQRARKAIVAQLKGYDPPLSPSEITAEQLRLEESIRKVEAEAARETLGYSQPASTAAPAAPAAPAKPPEAQRAEPKPPEPRAPAAPQKPQEPAAPAKADQAPAVSSPGVAADTPAGPDTLKSAIDDARKLGASADSAGRSARNALDGQPADSQKREPTIGTPEPDAGASASSSRRRSANEVGGATLPGSGGRPLPPIDGSMRGSRLPAIVGGVALLLLVVGVGAVGYSQRDVLSDLFAGDDGAATTASAPQTPSEPGQPEETEGSRKNAARLLDNGETAVAPDARSVTTTRITPTTPQTDPLAPTAPAPAETPDVRSVEPETPADSGEAEVAEAPQPTEPEAPAPETPAPAPTAPATQTPSDAQTAVVAQRAFLYEEGVESGSAGQASSGQTVWSVGEETIDGRTETVLRMRIEVPERSIVANLSLRPNRDDTLPASHLLEVRFELPQNFTGQGVAEVPGLVMKTTEEARGDALIGASVKVSDGFFWVALSNIPDERERNLTLLQERGWIDLPMLYENRKRAILTLEKGTPGTRAVEQAVTAWRAE
jgi:outer membrane biosynthesis protein TonB